MTRTTPPRPVDIASVFPELAPFARTATRLHPRPGQPTQEDSSVGGPLLWPIDDPWPYCEELHHPDLAPFTTLADVRLLRDTLKRPRPPDGSVLAAEEEALLRRIRDGHGGTDEPIAMVPVAQLYARDIPDLRPPEGCDLLQVLWCPFEHSDDLDPLPTVKLVWRSSSAITEVLREPPQPIVVESEYYVPEPCVVSPEQVIEYPSQGKLDKQLRQRIKAWDQHEKAEAGSAYSYHSDLSVAPGWKVGGWERWGFRDPWPMTCEECGVEMEPLLTISSGEWGGGNASWIPIEDRANAHRADFYSHLSVPTGVAIGRSYDMQIYICPVSADHPHQSWMQ